MVLSFLTAALLGLAAVTSGAPTMSTVQKLYLMEDMRQRVNTFYALNPPEDVEIVLRNLSDVTAPARAQACEDAYLIFTRGTFEPGSTANLGMMVGIPLVSAIRYGITGKTFGSIGVDYNNNVAGYLAGGDAAGGKKMAQMITDKVSQCPNTKIIAGGYSQGAQVTHNALATLSYNVASHIAAVVSFEQVIDPDKKADCPRSFSETQIKEELFQEFQVIKSSQTV
jgi:hypothetical protein